MANAFSLQERFITPQTSINRGLNNTVLAAKQQRFDSNVQEVNQAIQSFGNVDLIREQDREYLLNNLSRAVEIMDDEESDFSNSGLGQKLTTHLSKAIDSNVLEQVVNTQKIRGYQANVQSIKEKKPELYAQQNDWYATQSAGLDSYMQGESSNLGSLDYVPYNDYEKDLDKNLLTWAKEVGIETFYEPGEVDGIKFMMEGEELKKSDVKDFIRSRMDGKAQNQIFIDNSFNYKDNSTEELTESYKGYHSDLLDATKNRKAMELSLLRQQGLSSSPMIKSLEEKEAFHKKEMDSKNLDRDSMINFIGFESYLDRKAQPYADKDYTKISPDNQDIKRAELTYKKIKDLGKSSKAQGVGVKDIGGTLVPEKTESKDKEGLQTSVKSDYAVKREAYLGSLFKANPEFQERYNSLNSEEEKFNAIQQEMLLNDAINIGEEANPVLSRQSSEYKAAASNLNLITSKYKEGIEQTADRLYESMVSELASDKPDLDLDGLSSNYPKTVELLKTKKGNLSNKEKAIIRFEYAQDLKGNSAISDNANDALEDYILNQYEKVKDIGGLTDPKAKSELRKVIGNIGDDFSSAFKILGSGFDKEVIKQTDQEKREPIDTSKMLDQAGSFGESAGRIASALLTVGLSETLQPSDTGINDFDHEDLKLTDKEGNAIEARTYINNIFKSIDQDIEGDLGSSERRLPQSFSLTLNPVTAKYNPEIRKETANFFASKTGRDVKNNERLSISINKQDGSAKIIQISAKDGAVPIQVRLEELPESLKAKFETREKDWIFDASNPSAVSKNINYSISNNTVKADKHIENLKNIYQIPQVQGITDKEAARKNFAPSQQDILKGLIQKYPNGNKDKMNELILTPYEFEFYSGKNDSTYNYRIFKKKGAKKEEVYSNTTPMTTFNEASAVLNINQYLLRYFESQLNE